ncbi:MAG: M48 family metalloprotease [Bdellovibrionaceae bacterium]|nr:M48 family metalloprotease [Pseudobdellovibrionaceae bacterium]
MKFFEEQARARRQTFWLIVVFGVLIFLFSLMNSVLVGFSNRGWTNHFWPVFGITFFFFVASAWIHYLNIRHGVRVAELLGGRPLILGTKKFLESRCYNIVEEMAIASGVPIPQIYILDNEKGINAFVAGMDSQAQVLGVTAGALEKLSRDELQAVIGHEFSHIHNEDIALNVKLAGVVSGFFVFIRIGQVILDKTRRLTRSSSLSLLGLGFFAIGCVGWICGRVLQAMVCRRREYLADASSAQFTRHPESLARALGKILTSQTLGVRSSYGPELSHFFFSPGATESFWSDLIPTHPPTIERIRRLMPSISPEVFLKKIETEAIEEPRHKGEFRPTGWTEPSADPKFVLFRVLLSSQNEAVRGQILEYLRRTDPASEQEVRQEPLSDDVARFNLFRSALGKLQHSPQVEKDNLLKSMQAIFELDQVIEFEEGLYYLLAIQNLTPVPKAKKKISDLRVLEPLLSRWVPWILAKNNPDEIKRLSQIVFGRFEINPISGPQSRDSAMKVFLKDLAQDLEILSSLDGNLKNKLALMLRDLIQHQSGQPPKKKHEILLLAWVLQTPSKHII